MRAEQIIIEPVLSEKTNSMREDDVKKYTFKVNAKANKNEVVKAVAQLFNVRPVKCNVLTVKSKPKMARTRSGFRAGKTRPWKKAIVTLPKGDSIDVIEGM